MATNLDVDLDAIVLLMQLGGFRSKREAVDTAVAESIAWRRQLKASEVLATIDFRAVAMPGASVDGPTGFAPTTTGP